MSISVKNLIFLTSALFLVPAGCTHTETTLPQQNGGAPLLLTKGSCLELKDGPTTANAEEFEHRVGNLLKQNKTFSATKLVERFPDLANAVARSMLRTTQTGRTPPIPDPNLWEKISSLQPAQRPWPDYLAGTLKNYWSRRGLSHVAATPASGQDLVWF